MGALHPADPPGIMVAQVEHLPADIQALSAPLAAQAGTVLSDPRWAAARDVYLIGADDSYHAGRAAEMAFETIAGIACEPLSAQLFADYGVRSLRLRQEQPIVVAASASGNTPEVVEALRKARAAGACTVAITGQPESSLSQWSDHRLCGR